jgi:hypothetical protein
LKLSDAYDEFAAVAGIPPNLELLQSVAGAESAVALYDISKLEFLFLTRVSSARAMESALYKARNTFSPRNAAGKAYWVKRDGDGKRVAAFALAGDLLLVATREEALAGALTLLAGQSAPRMREESWFADAVKAAAAPGELRLVMNFERIVRSSHFRNQWVQGNGSEISEYRSGVADLRRGPKEWREERVLLRKEPRAAVAADGAGELLRLVPDNAGLYRAWGAASAQQAQDLLLAKVLDPQATPLADRQKIAPSAAWTDATAGNESDLEERLDQEPVTMAKSSLDTAVLRALLDGKVRAMLHVQSSRVASDGVFIANDSAVALLGTANWNAAAVESGIQSALDPIWSTKKLGLQWTGQAVRTFDGLTPIAVAVRGPLLIIGTRADLVAALLQKASTPVRPAATYAAGVRFAQERTNYDRIMQFIDNASANQNQQGGDSREPQYFSGNISSLAGVMRRLQSASIVARDTGATVTQSVAYQLAQ